MFALIAVCLLSTQAQPQEKNPHEGQEKIDLVETGYGTAFPKEPMNLSYYSRMAQAAGFVVEDHEVVGNTFRLVLLKN